MHRPRQRFIAVLFFAALPAALFCVAASPATEPANPPAPIAPTDSATDFILSHSSTTQPAPASVPTSAPTTPFVTPNAGGARTGTITLSDKTVLTGSITTTLDKPLRIWVESQGRYLDIPFDQVASIAAKVVWERQEREYQFLTSGSDVKTYTGRTYPARETAYTLTLADGKTIEGGIVAPFNIHTEKNEDRLIVLHKRDKGPAEQSIEDLVYVKTIVFKDKTPTGK
jgi:hypothetical protein